ncbi:MAG: WecB/TagA/CpsF family glycosyltransferase, partial [Methylocella sp.]
HRDTIGVPLIMGVGGGIDIIAQITKRAPVWMQRIGLEWLYRIIQEPRRMWKRYLTTNMAFAAIIAKAAFRAYSASRNRLHPGGIRIPT